jgi:hypothetical protein
VGWLLLWLEGLLLAGSVFEGLGTGERNRTSGEMHLDFLICGILFYRERPSAKASFLLASAELLVRHRERHSAVEIHANTLKTAS